MQFIKIKENFKQEIIIQDASTDKILEGDCMRKDPKIVSLKKIFPNIFQKSKNC